MQRTSKMWWEETKNSPEKFMRWLRKQYQGEVTAADRIEKYCVSRLAAEGSRSDPRMRGLELIAKQERQHAEWIGELLVARGELPLLLPKKDRYWEITLPQITDFMDACAVAHHAEMMRLERIRIIAEDGDAPEDVRETFERILKDELFHAKFFGECAGPEAIAKTKAAHLLGAEAIGFVTAAETM